MRGKVVKGGKVAARGKFKAEFFVNAARDTPAFLRRQSLYHQRLHRPGLRRQGPHRQSLHRRDLRLWGKILRRATNCKTQLIRAVLI